MKLHRHRHQTQSISRDRTNVLISPLRAHRHQAYHRRKFHREYEEGSGERVQQELGYDNSCPLDTIMTRCIHKKQSNIRIVIRSLHNARSNRFIRFRLFIFIIIVNGRTPKLDTIQSTYNPYFTTDLGIFTKFLRNRKARL
jgi:hypothetical protein